MPPTQKWAFLSDLDPKSQSESLTDCEETLTDESDEFQCAPWRFRRDGSRALSPVGHIEGAQEGQAHSAHAQSAIGLVAGCVGRGGGAKSGFDGSGLWFVERVVPRHGRSVVPLGARVGERRRRGRRVRGCGAAEVGGVRDVGVGGGEVGGCVRSVRSRISGREVGTDGRRLRCPDRRHPERVRTGIADECAVDRVGRPGGRGTAGRGLV